MLGVVGVGGGKWNAKFHAQSFHGAPFEVYDVYLPGKPIWPPGEGAGGEVVCGLRQG